MITHNDKVEIYRQFFLNNSYIPFPPHEKQADFVLNIETEEVLYGGAAGGGKSVALLMAALMFVDMPDYKAL